LLLGSVVRSVVVSRAVPAASASLAVSLPDPVALGSSLVAGPLLRSWLSRC
jgi:hypothetical protein